VSREYAALGLDILSCCMYPAGEIRGQITLGSMFPGKGSRLRFADLSGGAGVPGTPSTASGSGLLAFANGESQALVWLTLSGGSRVHCILPSNALSHI
jgi:hypothetical protein